MHFKIDAVLAHRVNSKFTVNPYMLQTSTAGPYFWLFRISGAAYAGDPHCVDSEVSP